jgi:predicted Fe-Mo cluster-binding NifX family protein
MFILIPVENENGLQSKITSLATLTKWALVEFDEGHTRSIRFIDEWSESGVAWIDAIVLENRYENSMEFIQEGILALVRRSEETIEEIMEAFRFKELDEVGL